jgi:nucleotide-binding universal stress UspA family protein
MYQRILLPLDGSELAERILPHTIELARRFGATVVLLHAMTSRVEVLSRTASADPVGASPVTAEVAEDVVAAEEDSTTRYFAHITERLQAEGLQVEQVIMEGDAVRTLAHVVKEQRIDLVTMATHGRSTLGRLFLGSVAESLLQEVEVPVLLLRADK